MYKKSIAILFFLLCPVMLCAGEDSLSVEKPSRFKGIIKTVYHFIQEFSRVDTNFVEPQHYNFQAMLQSTSTYEFYRMKNKIGQSVSLAPEMNVRVGPYVGWRWIFLGYTFDFKHLSSNNKKEIDLSLYSNQIGFDVFLKNTGNDYKIRTMYLGEGIDAKALKNIPFDGFKGSISGFNLYYIFNHRKFSYPAAFSQSTVQRVSCGSWLAGVGYTRHSLQLDYEKLRNIVEEKISNPTVKNGLDTTLVFSKVKYKDFSVSMGYAYNWVFAHNWLLAGSLSLALGYKKSVGDLESKSFSFRDFSFSNFNIDGVSRIGLVYNNTKWFAGMSAIFHTYNYKKDQFTSNNIFGNLNLYIGFNFMRR